MRGNYYLGYTQITWVGSKDDRGKRQVITLWPGQITGGIIVVQVVWFYFYLTSVVLIHGNM